MVLVILGRVTDACKRRTLPVGHKTKDGPATVAGPRGILKLKFPSNMGEKRLAREVGCG